MSSKRLFSFSSKLHVFRKPKVVDNLINYWKNIFNDYSSAVKDVVVDIKEKPFKGACIFVTLGAALYCGKTNPDMNSFRSITLKYANDYIFVASPIRNPMAGEHLGFIEQNFNEGRIRRFSLGIMSLIWVDNYNSVVKLYKSSCPYLKPEWLTFYERIVDVGFLDKWWIIDKKMVDFDVNPNEWLEIN